MTVSVDQWSTGGVIVALATPINLGFPVHAASEVNVYLSDGTLALLNVDYTVTLTPPLYATAQVVPLAGLVSKAGGNPVYVDRATVARQPVGLPANQKLPEPAIERMLDRIVMRLQEIAGSVADNFSRTLRVERGRSLAELKGPLADRYLGFDGQERPVALGAPTVNVNREGVFSTRAALAASFVAGTVLFVSTAGYAAPGDLGAVRTYVRVNSQPAHPFSVRSMDRFLVNGTIDTANGGWWVVADTELRPEMGGLVGNGSDETTSLQAMLDFAVRKTVIFSEGKTYGFQALNVPRYTTFRKEGPLTFRRLAASAALAGLTLAADVVLGGIAYSSPGGSGGDKALRVKGSRVDLSGCSFSADAEGVSTSLNWAIEIDSGDGSKVSRIKVDDLSFANYSTAIFARNAAQIKGRSADISKYRTDVYLIDCVRCELSDFKMAGLGQAVNGRNGENGLLLEATTANATRDLVFNDWIVEDAGEHSYRFGGNQTINNVTFNRCISRRSGSSILTGNLSGGEWHGGCGFKVLGGGQADGTRHKNIFFNECQVFDVNQTFGSYPAGHGVNNFTPFLITCGNNIHLNNCLVDAEQLATSCRNGILVTASKGVYLNDCNFLKCSLIAIDPYEEDPVVGFPGYDVPLEEFHIRGGLYEVVATGPGNGVVFYFSAGVNAAKYAHRNWSMKGVELRGGSGAMRIDTPSTGSFTNMVFHFTYLDPTSVSDATATSPIINGVGMAGALVDFAAVNRPAAFGISVANGSIDRQIGSGNFRLRKGGAWVTL